MGRNGKRCERSPYFRHVRRFANKRKSQHKPTRLRGVYIDRRSAEDKGFEFNRLYITRAIGRVDFCSNL